MNTIRSVARSFCIVASVLAAGCASMMSANADPKDFAGAWTVEWCDKEDAALECGGFDIDLVQRGERICGEFGGALIGLRQVDEGRIFGSAVGDTAILAVESTRNQAIVVVRAERRGERLHWKVVEEIKDGSGDIDVIASDDMLERGADVGKTSLRRLEAGESCASF
jgi:hypothetical protein